MPGAESPDMNREHLDSTVDEFVERWYRRDVDIGQTSIMGIPVDLLPDRVEKHLYKKMLLALLTLLQEGRPTLSFMGLELELRLRQPGDAA